VLRLGIIADDLTGATDTGVQLGRKGLDTLVALDLNKIFPAEVLVIDTESRSDSPELAYRKAQKAAVNLRAIGVDLIYKKIDSTLRGNVGYELSAIMDELKIDMALVAPAMPTYGRTTKGGYHLVNGIPLDKTEYALDPFQPIVSSHIPSLFQLQTEQKVTEINLSSIRKGSIELRREIGQLRGRGNNILVCDAISQSDLKIIAEAVMQTPPFPLLCGSAGLARELAEFSEEFRSWGNFDASSRPLTPRFNSPVLIIAGSYSKTTLEQIEYVLDRLDARLVKFEVGSSIEPIIKQALANIEKGNEVIVSSCYPQPPSSDKLLDREIRLSVGIGLGKIGLMILEQANISGLVLTGGETANHVLRALGTSALKIREEVLPGIPLVQTWGGNFEGLPVITKAGGFGRKEALLKIISYLRRKDES